METRKLAAAAGLGAVALVALAGPAAAHIEPEEGTVPAGSRATVSLVVPHGCDGEATTAFEVQIPEGVNDASPWAKAGWTISSEETDLETPIPEEDGGEITSRVSVITWTANTDADALPDHVNDRFQIDYTAPETAGEDLFFKVIQHCGDTTSDWLEEFTGEGEEPDHPAPRVEVVAATGEDDGHHDGGDDEGATATTAAAPGGSTDDAGHDEDDGDANGVAIAGLVAGVLGLAAGGAALARSRR